MSDVINNYKLKIKHNIKYTISLLSNGYLPNRNDLLSI
jgi:hypothetical protein